MTIQKKLWIILAGVILPIAVCCMVFLSGTPVKTKEEATQIAREYAKNKYNSDFNDYVISAELNDGVWTVSWLKNADLKAER